MGPLEPQVLHAKIAAKGRLSCAPTACTTRSLGEIESLARREDLTTPPAPWSSGPTPPAATTT
jgi:hypothetical protein